MNVTMKNNYKGEIMKKIIIGILCGCILSTSVSAINPLRFYKNLVKREKIGTIKEYWTEDLSGKILRNRGDSLIIEKVIGTVTNNRKDGRILNPRNPKYDYISYKYVKGCRKGDTILTVFIYEPGGNDVDEIATRFDYIIDTN